MFKNSDPFELMATLNMFPVPMFSAERESPDALFRVLCVNAAHTALTDLTTEFATGKLLSELLPPDQAEAVETRYARCIEQQSVINYRESLNINKKDMSTWETTLQPVVMLGGRQRIVGTSLHFETHDGKTKLEDVEYFASQAHVQLGHIQDALDTLEKRPDLTVYARERTMMISGLARGLDRLLRDLRVAAQRHVAIEGIKAPDHVSSGDPSFSPEAANSDAKGSDRGSDKTTLAD